jgi:hypothetical protein
MKWDYAVRWRRIEVQLGAIKPLRWTKHWLAFFRYW